jgi:GTPase SAR1 family protein
MNCEYNILVLGAGGVGKTAYLRRLNKHFNNGKFQQQYHQTKSTEEHSLTIENTTYHFTEYAGQRKYDYVKDGFDTSTYDGAIIMYDVGSRLSYRDVSFWAKLVGDLPYVVIGNKCDIKERKIQQSPIETSARLNQNLNEPITSLHTKITAQ